MTLYAAVVSTDPPTGVGNSKKVWSPELFESSTGAYPISPIPSVATYPTDNLGRLLFYESSIVSTGRLWPTSDDSGAGAAYSAEDQVLADLSQATGSYEWTATAPDIEDPDGDATNAVSVTFDFAGCTPDTTPVPLTLNICMGWEVYRLVGALGFECESSLQVTAWGFIYPGMEPPPLSGAHTDDPGQDVVDKYLETVSIGTYDPNTVSITVSAIGHSKKSINGYLKAPALARIFAICLSYGD